MKHRWYQKVELPDGSYTSGRDRGYVLGALLENEYHGASVLDVGCAEGLVCFEVEKRGANDVVGIECSEKPMQQALQLKERFGSNVTFRHTDATDVNSEYDYIYCLNVLHHLDDPIVALRTFVEKARRKLLLEVANVKNPDLVDLPVTEFLSRKHYITRSWLSGYLHEHYRLVPDFVDSDRPGYYLAVVRKAADELNVVAGYPAMGKSYVLRLLLHGCELPTHRRIRVLPDVSTYVACVGDVSEARRVFGIANASEWGLSDILSPVYCSKSVHHFDIRKPFKPWKLLPLERAGSCRVFVLVASRGVHMSRYVRREGKPSLEAVCSRYVAFAELCEEKGWETVYVDTSNGFQVVDKSTAFTILRGEA